MKAFAPFLRVLPAMMSSGSATGGAAIAEAVPEATGVEDAGLMAANRTEYFELVRGSNVKGPKLSLSAAEFPSKAASALISFEMLGAACFDEFFVLKGRRESSGGESTRLAELPLPTGARVPIAVVR